MPVELTTMPTSRYLSEQQEENYTEVRTKLLGQKIDTLLDFRLTDKVDHWHVCDVIIDGASIVSNYRAQFTSIIRNHSYAGLVNKMKEKTLVVKAFETTTTPCSAAETARGMLPTSRNITPPISGNHLMN